MKMIVKYLAVVFTFLGTAYSLQTIADTPFNTITKSGYETVYSIDGQLLISRTDKSIKFFDATTGKLKNNIQVKSLPPLKDGKYYIEYKPDYAFELFEVASGRHVKKFPGFSDYDFTEKEQNFYFSESIDVRLKDKRKRRGNELKQTHAVALTPDGQYIAACSKSNKLRVKLWNVKSGLFIKEIDLEKIGRSESKGRRRRSTECNSLIAAPDGSYFLINDSRGGMYLVEANTGKFLGTPLSTENGITASALSERGKNLIAINNNGRIIIWDIKNKRIIKKIETGDRDVKLLSATINGNYIAYVQEGKIIIWDSRAGKLIQTYSMFDTDIKYRTFSISFSPDGRFIATTDSANANLVPQIKIWDVSGKVTIQKLKASRLPGIVYKSNHFWQKFSNFSVIKNTFNGEFDGLERKKLFKVYYREFVNQYGLNCTLSGPVDKRRFVMYRVAEDEVGNEVSREKTTDVTTRMEQRFTGQYDEYKNAYNWFYTSKGFAQVLQQKPLSPSEWPAFQIENFFNQVPCHSATMFQLKENLWRVAHGKASLQAEGFKIAHAEEESDSVEDILSEKTLYEACRNNNGSKKYCMCFDKKARTVMTKGELTQYSEDFSLYYKEVTQKMEGIDKHSDLWRLYEPHRSGLRCK